MVDLLESRARFVPDNLSRQAANLPEDEPFFIPAVLPPRLALNDSPKPHYQSVGSVDITIKNSQGKLETFYGKVKSFNLDQGQIEVSIRGRGDSYAHVWQADGMTEVWFDRSEAVQRKESTLADEHPVFQFIINRLGPLVIEQGRNGESQAYANLGGTDFLGFLTNGRIQSRDKISIDRAA